jgi:hypothetical protein
MGNTDEFLKLHVRQQATTIARDLQELVGNILASYAIAQPILSLFRLTLAINAIAHNGYLLSKVAKICPKWLRVVRQCSG